MTFIKQNILSLLILTTLVLLSYINCLNNAFLSDDLPSIVNNPYVGNLTYSLSQNPFGFIRLTLYWTAFHINGLNPVFFRLINIFLHLGNIYLLYFIISLLAQKRIAFFATAIFAIHPLLTESITWISGGGYPQYTFFFLLSFLFYILSNKNRSYFIFSIIFYFLSAVSNHAMSASIILIYPLYEFAFGNFKKNWIKTVPFILICCIFLIRIFYYLPERENTLQSVHYQERGVDNIFVLVPIAITSYLNLIFYPKDLTLYHSELALSQAAFSLSALEFIAFIGIIIFAFKKDRKLFFWLALFFISLLPTLTPFRLNWVVAERYVYLGSIGIIVPLVIFLDKIFFKKGLKSSFYIILTLIIMLLSVRTIIRNIDWKNEDNLWIATGKTSPSSPNTHNNLGDVYGRNGDKQAALREFQKAIEIKPNYADAYHNLANTYREIGQMDKALENYQKASRYNPNLWQSYQNMAAIYFNEKQYNKALENMQKAINAYPTNIQLRNNLGIILLSLGQKDKAKVTFQLVLSVDPGNQFASQGLAETNKK